MNKGELHFRLMERTIKLNLQLHPVLFDSCFHFSPWLWHFHVINRWLGLWLFSTLVYFTCSSSIFSRPDSHPHLLVSGPRWALLWAWAVMATAACPHTCLSLAWLIQPGRMMLSAPGQGSRQPLGPLSTPSAPRSSPPPSSAWARLAFFFSSSFSNTSDPSPRFWKGDVGKRLSPGVSSSPSLLRHWALGSAYPSCDHLSDDVGTGPSTCEMTTKKALMEKMYS